MPSKRKNVLISEFVVEVHPDRIDWGGAEALPRWLMRRRPQEGFAPHAKALSRLPRAPRPRKAGR